MITDDNKDEIIEQYLLGLLDGQLLEEFNTKLQTDTSFRKEVALEQAMVRNIRTAGRQELRAQLNNFHLEMNNSTATLEAKILRIPIWQSRFFWIAASVLVLLATTILWLQTSTPTPTALATAYYKPYAVLGNYSQRGGQSQTETEQAFESYTQARYTESIQRFRRILEKEKNEEILFYLGNAYLGAGQSREAIETFVAYRNQYTEFRTDATWYLALSYLQDNQPTTAQLLLVQLSSTPNPYQEKAQEILSKLT